MDAPILVKHLTCNRCKTVADVLDEVHSHLYETNELLKIACPNRACKEPTWRHCKSCKSRFGGSQETGHAGTMKHKNNHKVACPPRPPDPPSRTCLDGGKQATIGCDPLPGASESVEDFPGVAASDDVSLQDLDSAGFIEQMDGDLGKTYIDNAESSMEISQPVSNVNDGRGHAVTAATENDKQRSVVFPPISMQGNEWLKETMTEAPIATIAEMHRAFNDPLLQHMKNFWLAELASGEGRCGGGLCFLVARTWQQTSDARLNKASFPSCMESKWHFDNLQQYQSMNEKQRKRQSRINRSVVGRVNDGEGFFQKTYIPPYNQLGRFYGSSGKHSLYNILPIPKAEDIDGVAYVPIKAIIAFAIANGIPMDNMVIKKEDASSRKKRKVQHVEDCRKAQTWFESIVNNYYSKDGAPKQPAVVGAYLVTWKDGFGPNRNKSNRGSVDIQSVTISPTKEGINGTGNTFCLAMGLKNAPGWDKTQRRFQEELKELTGSDEPHYFFNGAVQKIVPYFFKQFVYLADKVERSVSTGVIGCGSDTHRRHGVGGRIQTPSCDTNAAEQYLNLQQQGQRRGCFGWSQPIVSFADDGKIRPNGAWLPSCNNCRKACLKILGIPIAETWSDGDSCKECAAWDLLGHNKSLLDFTVHKFYPKKQSEGCPIQPPSGRAEFKKDASLLPFVNLDWNLMIKASKFAWYQASRPTKAWSKQATMSYLKYCGVNPKFAEELYNDARECCKAKTQDEVDFSVPDRISSVLFPAAWIGELTVNDYIETIMHLLFLGVGSSNFELITFWLTSLPAGAKMSSAAFRSDMQPLLKELKRFRLSWLLAYPFTGDKKAGSSLGTGSWVSENWLCFVRISKILFAWCMRDKANSYKYGAADMSRMVISFVAFTARCLTHSGIDDNFIEEIKLYMKEFLSCVHEFDIRVRSNDLNRKKQPASSNTETATQKQKGDGAKKKKGGKERNLTEAWWLKPNYMSLCNVLHMMMLLGPLYLWWDGGGKGERFVQLVKPLIKRGIREDISSFFLTLVEKLFRLTQIEYLERRYNGEEEDASDGSNDGGFDSDVIVGMTDLLTELADAMPAVQNKSRVATSDFSNSEDDSTVGNSNRSNNESSDSDSEEEEITSMEKDDAYFSKAEEHGMTKKSTMCVYRNENHVGGAIDAIIPLAGIVELKQSDSGETAFEFQTIYRKPGKQFARWRVTFQDEEGVSFHGLWWAGIQVDRQECSPPTTNFSDIQSSAKLSAVAIPMWYVIGKDKPDSNKYCVITNWWKERMSNGRYQLPGLDESLHEEGDSEENDGNLFGATAEVHQNATTATLSEDVDAADTGKGNNSTTESATHFL